MQKSILTIVAILFLTVTALSIGIYRFGWDNFLTRKFLNVVPLPIARVDSKFISFRDFYDRFDAYHHLVVFQSDYNFQKPEAVREISKQKKLILDNLVEEKVLEGLTASQKIQISQQEADKYFQFLLNEFKLENPEEEIQKLFGWSVRKFKANIVWPDLLRAKLAVSLLEEAKNSSTRKQAEQVLREVQTGLLFADAAAKYSEDEETRFIGGDLGFVILKELSPWMAAAAEALEKNQLSGVVASPLGYHILEVLEKDERSDSQKIHLRHILIREDLLSPLLEQRRETVKIWIWGGT